MARLKGQTTAPLPAVRMGLTDAECRALVEQQPLVTYIDGLGAAVETLFVSENVFELSGYTPERWRSAPDVLFAMLHPGDRARVRAAHVAAAESGGPYKGDFRLVRPDGEVVWVQAEDQVVRGDDGRPLYRLGYLVDITERRATEDELRQAGTRLTTLIGSLQAGVLLEDEHRRVVLTNSAFCDIFAIPASPAQLVGADCLAAAEQSKTLMADPGGFLQRVDAILSARTAVHGEEVEFADGRVFERDYVPILVEDRNRGHLWGYRDVTPRIEAQRAVEEAHDEAVAASQAKSAFLATVSHEIRTPMHGVLGTIDLLQRTELDAEQAELASIANSSAIALLAVINDMLDLQRAETGHTVLASVPVDLAAVVAGVVGTLRAAAAEKALEVVVELDDDLPADLLGDPGRLRQILLNLVANAVKFTERGHVAVHVGLVSADAVSAAVRLTVADTGIGIDDEARERIFEPFAQADTSSARRHEGTGLGLAITRRLVELMQGTVDLESASGEGTTVTAEVHLARGRAPASEPAGAAAAVGDLRGSVLVAEDSQVNRAIAEQQLRRLGVRPHLVDSGGAAIEALEAGHYDAVLMDMRMPGMTGIQAARAIRARELETGRPRVGIIAMTANAMPEDRDACFAAGMDDFATKPLSLDGLAAVLRRWLGAEGPQPAAAGSVADPPAPLGVAGTLDRMADELGSPVAVRKLAQTWLGELPGRLEDLRDAARARDAERLRHGAHTLKSTSALVGAARAAELAAEAERLAAAGAEPVPVDALIAEAEIAADLVREWVSDTPADPAP